MSRPWRVAAYDDVLAAALDAARARGVYLIARLQDSRDWGVLAKNGALERVAGGRAAGLGVQVFTLDGHCGFASSDLLEPGEAQQLVQRAALLAEAAGSAGAEPCTTVFTLQRESTSAWPDSSRPIEASSPEERRASLLEAHRRAIELAAGLATHSSLGLVDEEWRVARSDGTDVRFRLPHGLVRHRFTARGGGQAATASCSLGGADDRVVLEPDSQERLYRRAVAALRRARDVVGAPTVVPGHYQVVLDHSMAKNLAHEAIGHAVETDVAENSFLARDGRLRLGERLAPPGLSIVDGPLEGDLAYQPISANGVVRQTVSIIDHGVLRSGLGDVFSAERAGSPVTGAGRLERFHARPFPRMSNIRLVLDQAAPLDQPPESVEPRELCERLAAAGLLDGSTPTLFLAGHRGGQTSPLLGDFVFNCTAIYDLTAGAEPRQSGIFSGKSLAALSSVVGALGELVTDAPGHCVKGGQGVPTSGGSQAFVVLAPHSEVTVGGG